MTRTGRLDCATLVLDCYHNPNPNLDPSPMPGAGAVTRIGRLDCTTLVLDGWAPVRAPRAGATPGRVRLGLRLRSGAAAAACGGGAFAGANASAPVAVRCRPGHPREPLCDDEHHMWNEELQTCCIPRVEGCVCDTAMSAE